MRGSRFISLILLSGGISLSASGRVLQYIPAGSCGMGDASFGEVGEGMADERPVHTVTLSAFYLEDQEVTAGLWESVRGWAMTNGYSDLPAVAASAELPATGISWYDSVKWCNARSEMEGLAPVYFTDAGQTNIYRTGTNDLTTAQWSSGVLHIGYRLPTEAEWEMAAHGGTTGSIFPWMPSSAGSYRDHITTNQASYGATAASPVASFAANGFGLYDMAGNAAEWCWDWYDADYYSRFPTNGWPANPRGPDSMLAAALRGTRGGSWASDAFDLRCSFRDPALPGESALSQGFRCARDFTGNEDLDTVGDGVPDWWRQVHFGRSPATNNVSCAACDPDGDGMSNLQEYLAGFDPMDQLSLFRCVPVRADETGFVIQWTSASNRLYDVLFTTNLLESFSALESNLLPTPPVNVYTDSVHTTAPFMFYRIGVHQ